MQACGAHIDRICYYFILLTYHRIICFTNKENNLWSWKTNNPNRGYHQGEPVSLAINMNSPLTTRNI